MTTRAHAPAQEGERVERQLERGGGAHEARRHRFQRAVKLKDHCEQMVLLVLVAVAATPAARPRVDLAVRPLPPVPHGVVGIGDRGRDDLLVRRLHQVGI